jgi:hypothetical protein
MAHRVMVSICLVWCGAMSAHADSIEWSAETATLEGSGCRKDLDAFVVSTGSDISVIFSALGFSLSGQNSPMAANRNCNIRLPASVPPGRYIATLDQSLFFGAVKSTGSDAAFQMRARFFNQHFLSPGFVFARGQAVNDPQKVESRRDRFESGRPGQGRPWIDSLCKRGRPATGAFQGQIAVRGKRDSKAEDLILFVDGLDLRFEIEAQLANCP